MHPADVVAAVRKKGTSLAQLARDNGLSHAAIRCSLKRPFRRAERVLSDFLGIAPQTIWPDRYDVHGNRLVRPGRRVSPTTTVNNSSHRRTRGQ